MLATGYTSLIMLVARYTSLIMLATGYTSLIMLAAGYTFRFPNHASRRLHFSLPYSC